MGRARGKVIEKGRNRTLDINEPQNTVSVARPHKASGPRHLSVERVGGGPSLQCPNWGSTRQGHEMGNGLLGIRSLARDEEKFGKGRWVLAGSEVSLFLWTL